MEEKEEYENYQSNDYDVAKNATMMLCNILYDKKVFLFYFFFYFLFFQKNNPSNKKFLYKRSYASKEIKENTSPKNEKENQNLEENKEFKPNKIQKDFDFIDEDCDFPKYFQKDLVVIFIKLFDLKIN